MLRLVDLDQFFLTCSLPMTHLFCKADFAHCDLLKNILHVYGAALGQVINFDKSSVSFSKNVLEVEKGLLANRLGGHQQDYSRR